MGNSSFVSITLTDNINNTYVAGDTINGIIYVNVKENRRVQSLLVTICGYEKHSAFNKATNASITQRNILDSSIPLIQFTRELVKGQYEYPFKVILPETLPSTIERNKFGDIFVEVSYLLDVKFNGERTLATMLKNQTLSDRKTITIIKKPHPVHLGPNGLQEPLLLPPTTKNLKSFKCFKRGYFSLTGFLLNPVVDNDEKIKLRLVTHYWCKKGNNVVDASHLIRVADVQIVQEVSTYADADKLTSKHKSKIYKGKFTCRRKTFQPRNDQFSHFSNANNANNMIRNDCIRTLHDITRENGTRMTTGNEICRLNDDIDPSGALQVDDIEITIPENRRKLQPSDKNGDPKNLIYSYMGHIVKVRHFIKIYFKSGWSVPEFLTECSIFFEPLHQLSASNRSNEYAAAAISRVHEQIPDWHAVPANLVSLDFSQAATGVNPNPNYSSSLTMADGNPDQEMQYDNDIYATNNSTDTNNMKAIPIEATMVSSSTVGAEPIYVNARAVDGMAIATTANGAHLGVTVVNTPQEILADFIVSLQNCVDDVATTVRFCSDPDRSVSLRVLGPLELGRLVAAIHEPRDVHTVVSYIFNRMIELGNKPSMQHLVSAVLYADPAAIMSLIRVGAINLGEEVFQSQINNLLMALNDDIANLVRVEFQSGGNPNPNTMSNNSGTRNVVLESSNSNNINSNRNSNSDNERIAVAS